MIGSFLSVKEPPLIKTDIHSHLIPGIDDGVKTVKESLSIIRQLYDLGYRRFITTPHIMQDRYDNTSEKILSSLDQLLLAIHSELEIDVAIEASAEYYLDEQFLQLIATKKLLPFFGNHILFEMSYVIPPTQLELAIFEMQSAGYQPVLAHPERFMYFHHDINKYRELKERGVKFQVNINSLGGYYTRPVQKMAAKLLKEGMIDFLGSDVHHQRHVDTLIKTRQNSLYRQAFTENTILNDDHS